MLGIKMEELAEQQWSCALKTLRRLEHNRVNTHHDIAEELLEKLGLSAGYQRMGIITDDRRAIELYGKWKHLCNEFKYEECREVLAELEVLLPKNLVNEQFIEWAKVSVAYWLKEIDTNGYIEIMNTIINKVIDIDKLLIADNLFLSDLEKIILYSISSKYKSNGDLNNAFRFIKPIYDCLKEYNDIEIEKNIRTYELLMTYISSLIGSMGEYDISNELSKNVIRAQLKYGRIHIVHKNLSSMSWNSYQQDRNKKAYRDRLYQCMLWSLLRKDENFANRYKERLLKL